MYGKMKIQIPYFLYAMATTENIVQRNLGTLRNQWHI